MKTNIDYWEEVTKNQPLSYQKWFEDQRRYLRKHITPNSRVLDVGCGTGRSFVDFIDISQNVVGIDHDEAAIEKARAEFINYPTVQFVKADATDISFSDGEFDFVICMGTFANFADNKIKVLEEMKRVLKDSGKIIISVFSENAFEERMSLYKSMGVGIKEIRGTTVVFDESVGDNISEQFSATELKEIFGQAGLEIENIEKGDITYSVTLTKTGSNVIHS
jgi:ubiquinone/menaquinone biosynthesis C-methylase UbiE